ncbi:MAG: nicotinate (nicotinamide) nucleotide adenylyltransferase [Fusobacteriaceae bacterium]|jgi:nicotinate-nucleotide adenylyltransferase|nr:nicotinate (nicotinamide) nucleotide adenylyltransferase [Fusobacteriaceae bacterium]
MKIGIYGGLFDPIHIGHISVVKFVSEYFKMDKIIVIPVGIPSHRENNAVDGNMRIKMCQMAFENIDRVEVSDIEVIQNKLCYTYDTLCNIIEIYGENNEYFEIIGEDSLNYFKTWKKYEEILKKSKLIVLKREGYNEKAFHENIILIDSPYFPYSSTKIRDVISKNGDISGMVTEKVRKYIETNNLYKS